MNEKEQINDGGPAFPRPSGEAHDAMGNTFWPCANEGMSLRDYFAGMALQGFAANTSLLDVMDSDSTELVGQDVAECSYRWADAMLTVRGDQ